VNGVFAFGDGLSIQDIPGWIKEADVVNSLDAPRKMILQDSTKAFVATYQAASLGDPDPRWTGPKPRGKQDLAHEDISFAILSIWIVRPSQLGHRLYIDGQRIGDKWQMRGLNLCESTLPLQRDVRVQVSRGDLELAGQLYPAMKKIPRGGTMWTALRAYNMALSVQEWNLRYVLLWIGLEALFGPADGRKISFRLAKRMALFLKPTYPEAKAKFQIFKELYSLRSKAVHGMRLQTLTAPVADAAIEDIDDALRISLGVILRDSKLTDLFAGPEKAREQYLDELVFGSSTS